MVMMVTQVLLGNGFKSAFMLPVMGLLFFCFLQCFFKYLSSCVGNQGHCCTGSG